MTVPTANHPAVTCPSAQIVGNAFVYQYYYVLCNSPQSVYKFYNDSSFISRPESDGTMVSVTTLKAIDEKIQSLDSKNSKPEIETVDSQESYQTGVIVVVTGSLIGSDGIKRKFSQTFFLAPQEKGYFVLNDVLRYVEEIRQLEINSAPVDCDDDSVPSAPLSCVSEATHVLPGHTSDPSSANKTQEPEESEAQGSGGEIYSSLDEKKHLVVVQESVNEEPTHHSQDDMMADISSDSSGIKQENRSYASIVKTPKSAAKPADKLSWAPTKTSQNKVKSTSNISPEPEASAPTIDNGPEGHNPPQEDVEGHSIYIRNLPVNTTVSLVTKEFSKFGPIKHGGVQVKVHKTHGYHYGFVEFETLDSMHNAVKESPIAIGRRQVVVEEKKSTIKVGRNGNTERYTSGRGEIQNSFRGRGYVDNRYYGKSEIRINRNFPNRPKSNSGSNTEYRYQRVERGEIGNRGSQAGG